RNIIQHTRNFVDIQHGYLFSTPRTRWHVLSGRENRRSVVGDVNRVEADPSGMDPADDPRLPCALLERVDVSVEGRMAGVLAGDGVKVVERTLGGQDGVTADLNVPRGVVGIDDEQADFRVRDHVATLLPLECGVDGRDPVLNI